jgi:plasmid maintenance system killer protein
MNKKIVAILGIIAVVIIIASVFMVQKRAKVAVNQTQQSQSQTKENQQSQDQIRQANNGQNLKQPVDNNEILIADKDKWSVYANNTYKLSFQYPSLWKVNPISPSDLGGKLFSIAPEKAGDNGKLRFTIAIINSKDTPDVWYKNNIENPDNITNYNGEIKKININGDDVYYVKKISGSNINGVSYINYIDQSYIFSNKNSILLVSFREDEISYENNTGMVNSRKTVENESDYSSYLPDFEYFVNSIKFTK